MYTLLLPLLLIPVLLSSFLEDRHIDRQMCDEVSTEIRAALRRGEITKRTAKRLIGNCYSNIPIHDH